ncbi:hypothetical protein [Thermococcus thermotolerans]|uniref:hypothetical protein n=1 Tax=Thermococcus thermotolerans TaxID=2969672 RepID=UPI0021579671|nr:hypothetical protein [Thermococcus thermotolerans]
MGNRTRTAGWILVVFVILSNMPTVKGGDTFTKHINATVDEKWIPLNMTHGDILKIKITSIDVAENITFVKGPGIVISPVGGRYPSLSPIVVLYFDMNGSIYAFFPGESVYLGTWKPGSDVTVLLTTRRILLYNGNVSASFEAPTEIEPVSYLTVRTSSVTLNATIAVMKTRAFEGRKQSLEVIPSVSFVFFAVVTSIGAAGLVVLLRRRK